MGVLRQTKSVRIILELFEQTNKTWSAIDLVERLKSEMNKTTVYRILERLEGEGILHTFKGNGGLLWYAKCQDCTSSHHQDLHPHFQCKDCGKTECLNVELPIPSVSNHKVESAELLLVGQCEDCIP